MRGRGHNARVRPLPGIPVSSLLTGCWAPPSSFPAPVGAGPFPVRHFRRARRGRKGEWRRVLGSGPEARRSELEVGGLRSLREDARSTVRPNLPGNEAAGPGDRRLCVRRLPGVLWRDRGDLVRGVTAGARPPRASVSVKFGMLVHGPGPPPCGLIRGALLSWLLSGRARGPWAAPGEHLERQQVRVVVDVGLWCRGRPRELSSPLTFRPARALEPRYLAVQRE